MAPVVERPQRAADGLLVESRAFHPSHDVLAFSEHLLALAWLDGCPGRYLRLRLVAESPTQRWSVAEVSMFEPAPTGARMVAGTICRP
jgi:hypothetical protein